MAQGRVGFLFDAHIPTGLADALNALGERVEHVNQLFPPGTSDETWIRYAGDRYRLRTSFSRMGKTAAPRIPLARADRE